MFLVFVLSFSLSLLVCSILPIPLDLRLWIPPLERRFGFLFLLTGYVMLANCVTVEKHRVEKKFWWDWAPAEYSNQTTSDLWTIDIGPSDQRSVTVWFCVHVCYYYGMIWYMPGMFVEDFVSVVVDVNTRSRRFFSLVGSSCIWESPAWAVISISDFWISLWFDITSICFFQLFNPDHM